MIRGVPSILPTAVGVIGSVDVTPTEMRDNVVFFVLRLHVLEELVTTIEELEDLDRVNETRSIDPMLVGAAFGVGRPLFAEDANDHPNEPGVKLIVTARPTPR